MSCKVAVVGAGVAGLCAVWHLLELWETREALGLPPQDLELLLLAPLTLDAHGDGSGLGGKAMSRHHEGPRDRHGNERALFYGPLMPHKGTIPHGFHVLWEYPNLRRMLGDGAPDEPSPPLDGGLLRPKGGAGAIAIFQGNLDDPAPGGPGIAVMGLSDPDQPWTATRPATRALYRLKDTPLLRAFTEPMGLLFDELSESVMGGIHPLFFADLFYAHEVDLEMRLALIVSSLKAHTTDPERATIPRGEQDVPLYDAEYTEYIASEVIGWAKRIADALDRPPTSRLLDELSARAWIVEAQLESTDLGGLDRLVRSVLPASVEERYSDAVLLVRETERVLRALPAAVTRLASGHYPLARTFHLRFGPDATFTSPYSYDAAQALRSLAFVFTTPHSARAWFADGGQIQRMWVRLWRRIQSKAETLGPRVKLTVEKGRAWSIAARRDGQDGVEVTWGEILGHGFGMARRTGALPGADLSYPHTHLTHPSMPPPGEPATWTGDAVVPTMAPDLLAALLGEGGLTDAADGLAPLRGHANVTLELMLWTRERIRYSEAAAVGLSQSAITGLEGGFCLIADYAQGLWSDEVLGSEDPFSDGQPFRGSVIESCGAWDDVFACQDRGDPYGWPTEVKEALAALMAEPGQYADRDTRPWVGAESPAWEQRRAGGGWTPERLESRAALDDWFVASRWMTWQFLRQVSQIQSLGASAVRQLAYYADLLDPRGVDRDAILAPPASLGREIRYVVMINAKPRNRIFSPGVGLWPHRPMSGAPLAGAPRVFPAGDWTRNGLDIVCMEAACISAMRAARGLYAEVVGEPPPAEAPRVRQVMPDASWYVGLDPLARPGTPVGEDGRLR